MIPQSFALQKPDLESYSQCLCRWALFFKHMQPFDRLSKIVSHTKKGDKLQLCRWKYTALIKQV